jgi:uncharacterized protein YjbI with pentapeptide repeats
VQHSKILVRRLLENRHWRDLLQSYRAPIRISHALADLTYRDGQNMLDLGLKHVGVVRLSGQSKYANRAPEHFFRVALLAALIALMGIGPLDVRAQESDPSESVKALGNCEACVLDAQDYSDRRLSGINFETARLSNILFVNADMNIAVFNNANLRNVSFDGADLKGASFVGARLENVTFVGANLSGAVFEEAVLDGTDLQPALLCNTQLTDDVMDSSDCE